jgi:heat shock protein 1/8
MPAVHHLSDVGGDAIDNRLLKFFAWELMKKTSVRFKVAPAASDIMVDLQAEACLPLSLLHSKRTTAASSIGGRSGTAPYAV